MKRRLLWVVAIVVLAGGITGGYLYTQGVGARPAFRTAAVSRGPLTAAVSATGTLNAVITVQVGSQVSGQIKELLADFNSLVKKDQVIARIDPDTFEAKVNQTKAQVDAARASVLNQQAALEKTRADLENARAALAAARAQTAKSRVAVVDSNRTLGRNRDLRKRGLIAQAAYDSAVAQLDASGAQEQAQVSAVRAAEAQLRVAEAMLQNAIAQVAQNEAAQRQAQVDLDHTYIRAPVDGVVVGRTVDVGQTVAASLQAPTLFTIAQDLRNMQVDTNVDEADVGRVKVGQATTFTVDSFPGRTFTGEVVQIRKAPLVVQNVVTYDVVVTARNPEQRLLPGMTANVRIIIDQKEGVLQVPNAALRFRPPGVEAAERARPAGRPSGPGGGAGRGGGAPAGRVFVLGPDGKPTALSLQLGIGDGTYTEVVRGELTEGQQVIVGVAVPGDRSQPPTGTAPRLRF